MQIPILDPARMTVRRRTEHYANSPDHNRPRLPCPQPTNLIPAPARASDKIILGSKAPRTKDGFVRLVTGDVRYGLTFIISGMGIAGMLPFHHQFAAATAAGAGIACTLLLGRRYGLMAGLIAVLAGALIMGSGFLNSAAMVLAVIFPTHSLASNYMFKSFLRSFFCGICLSMLSAIVLGLTIVLEQPGLALVRNLRFFLAVSGHEISLLAVSPDSFSFSGQIILICILLPALGRIVPSTWQTGLRFRPLRPPWEYRR